MKNLIILFLFCCGVQALAAQRYETQCKRNDCFRYGWVTTGENYKLETICKNGDCRSFGWGSKANDQSTYEVSCHGKNCFVDGWHSLRTEQGLKLEDEVTCKSGECLTVGWIAESGYDLMGGDVTCNQNDCSKYGGYSKWRGKNFQTVCYHEDCYHIGWALILE